MGKIKFFFSFKGSVDRSTFLKHIIPILAVFFALSMIPPLLPMELLIAFDAVIILMGFPVVISYFSFIVRRLHDLGYVGYEILIPFYNLYLLVLVFVKK